MTLQKTAFGPLNLSTDEFWSLTPNEFRVRVDAFSEEEERTFENFRTLLGWHAVNIMNACGQLKKPITLEKLLGSKKKKKSTNKKSLEDLKKDFGFS